MATDYPVVRHIKTDHAVRASGNADDGSLWGFLTLCGLVVKDDQHNPDWQEIPDGKVTCKRCQRSIRPDEANKETPND